MKIALHGLGLIAALSIPLSAPGRAADTVPVTVDNFIRAESDLYIGNAAKEGGLGKLSHRREPASIDKQSVIRLNRDAMNRMRGEVTLEIVPGATHLFEEPGGLERVATLAGDWLERHLPVSSSHDPKSRSTLI